MSLTYLSWADTSAGWAKKTCMLLSGTMEAECNSFFIRVTQVMNQKILHSLSSWFSALHLLTGIYWKVLIGGGSSWVLSERISGLGRVLLWCASEFWLTWGIILRGKCCLSGSHSFSCPSQLCRVHTFLLLPGHWVTTGRKQDSFGSGIAGILEFCCVLCITRDTFHLLSLFPTPELHTAQSASCFLAVCVALVQTGGVAELRLKIPWHVHPFLSFSSLGHIFITGSFLISHLRLFFLRFIVPCKSVLT